MRSLILLAVTILSSFAMADEGKVVQIKAYDLTVSDANTSCDNGNNNKETSTAVCKVRVDFDSSNERVLDVRMGAQSLNNSAIVEQSLRNGVLIISFHRGSIPVNGSQARIEELVQEYKKEILGKNITVYSAL